MAIRIGPIIPDKGPSPKPSPKPKVKAADLEASGASKGEAARFANIANNIKPPATPKPVIPAWPNGFDGMTGNTDYSNRSPTPGSGPKPNPKPDPKPDPKPNASPTQTPEPTGSVSSVPATPTQPQPSADVSVKSPSPDLIQIDRLGLPKNLMLRLALEKIGAQELITLVRHDTVNGQSITYQPVKNLSDIAIAYNPQNIIKIPDTSNSYFKNFAIQLENHIPQFSNDSVPVSVYLQNSGIVIDLINLKADYEVEVQTMSSGQIFNATIYEEDVS
jgi:hypothetical protein